MENGHMFPESEDTRDIAWIYIEELEELQRLAEIGKAAEWAGWNGYWDDRFLDNLLDDYRSQLPTNTNK